MMQQGQEQGKYCFEIFEAPHADFPSSFTDFLNQKDSEGWEYEDCKFVSEADNCKALCVFEKD